MKRLWLPWACAALWACFPGERQVADHLECFEGACHCGDGFGNCDDDPGNGCETVVAVDASNCGGCGVRCTNGYCEDGACVCGDDFAICEGSCVSLDNDPLHCGVCERDCLGGTCSEGRCAPAPLAIGFNVGAMALRQDQVFMCDYQGGSIVRLDLAGGAGEILATDEICDSHIGVAGDAIVWSVWLKDDEAVRMLGPNGVTTLGVALYIDWLSANDNHIVWVQDDSLEITIVRSNGGPPTTVATPVGFLVDIALSGDDLFWLESDLGTFVYQADLTTGGPPTQLWFTDDDLRAFTIAGDYIYAVRCPPAGEDCDEQRQLIRMPKTGGAAEVILDAPTPIIDLVGDGDDVFWTEGALEYEPDRIVHMRGDTFETTLLTKFQDVSYLAIASRQLVWYDIPSRIFTLAK